MKHGHYKNAYANDVAQLDQFAVDIDRQATPNASCGKRDMIREIGDLFASTEKSDAIRCAVVQETIAPLNKSVDEAEINMAVVRALAKLIFQTAIGNATLSGSASWLDDSCACAHHQCLADPCFDTAASACLLGQAATYHCSSILVMIEVPHIHYSKTRTSNPAISCNKTIAPSGIVSLAHTLRFVRLLPKRRRLAVVFKE